MPIALEGPYAAKVMIVGDCPCYEDTKTGRNFSGSSGRMLDTLLTEAGTSRNECLLTTVARDCPPGGKVAFFYEDAKMLIPTARMREYIQALKADIQFHRPNIIIALGHVAMNVLTGNTGITKYRGYIEPCTLVPGIKVLATHHPSSVTTDVKLAFQFILDVRKAVANSVFAGVQETKHELQIDLSYTQFIDYCDYLLHDHKDKISLDIETLSPGCHIDVIGLGESATKAVSFPILLNRTARFSSAQELTLWEKINEVVNAKEVIMQNGLFDAAVLLHHTGIWCSGYKYDTLLAAHACWPECPRSLSFLASICLNVPAWKHTANDSPLLYNAADAANTWGIWEVLESQMAILGTRAVHDFEMEQSEVAIMLQLQGVRIDLEKRDKKVAALKESIRLAKLDLEQKLGRTVNFASPKQMQDLLYKDLMLPVQYKRRKHATEERKITTNEEALVNLSRKSDNPVLNDIISVKKQMKLLTFMDIEVSPQGRVHTCYNITGATMVTETKGLVVDDEEQHRSFGRWSSSSSIILEYGSGNFQNIPKDARELYVTPPGHSLVQADYKQAEAVVVAYVIGDNKLKKLFQDSYGLSDEECKERGLDVHKLTASMMFGIPVDLITADQRKVGKMIRHATNYSAGPGVLSTKLNISTNEAKVLLGKFASGCPMLALWHGTIREELRQTRMLTNLLGRKHKFLDRWGDGLFRSAYSFIPQSTVGDLLNRALVDYYRKYASEDEIALQLHDAIYCIVPDDLVERCKSRLRECMTIPLTARKETFCIDVDFKVGKSWKDMGEE